MQSEICGYRVLLAPFKLKVMKSTFSRVSYFPQGQYFLCSHYNTSRFFKDFFNFLKYHLHSFEEPFLRNAFLLNLSLASHIL